MKDETTAGIADPPASATVDDPEIDMIHLDKQTVPWLCLVELDGENVIGDGHPFAPLFAEEDIEPIS